MSDGSRYHLQRGKTPRLVDDVGAGREGDELPAPPRSATPTLPLDLRDIAARTRTPTRPVDVSRTLTPPRTMTAPIPSLAQGSGTDLRPIGLDLDDLADVPTVMEDGGVPVIERTPTSFGPNQLMVEYHGDRVAIVLPGVVRLIGTVEDGRRLAELLARRPR